MPPWRRIFSINPPGSDWVKRLLLGEDPKVYGFGVARAYPVIHVDHAIGPDRTAIFVSDFPACLVDKRFLEADNGVVVETSPLDPFVLRWRVAEHWIQWGE